VTIIISDGPEDSLADQLSYAGIEFIRQYKPYPSRRFKVDFYIPHARLIIEVDGGIYAGRPSHSSATGIVRDMEKTNLATINGYRLLRVTSRQAEDGEALNLIEAVLKGEAE
jgi:very-short-patch-repair endonuclease